MKPSENKHHAPLGLRSVALFEAAKGTLVLVIGMGALSLIHKDVQVSAERILKRMHLDPAWHYSRMFVETASKLTDARLRYLALAALIYALIRYVETYGLWHERPWAEWFAVISASLYVPVEIYHLFDKFSLAGLAVFLVNIIIVLYLGSLLYANHRRKQNLRAAR